MLEGDAISSLTDAKGQIRARWRSIFNAMQAIGADEFAARAVALDRRARFESPNSNAPLQRLDPIPIPLMDYEFDGLAAGIIERAEGLSNILDDLYGPQLCIANGSLPDNALFANRQFVRNVARHGGTTGHRLASYAVDLIRTQEDSFQVLCDHTDCAPDLGLALASRRFVAEVVPELFGAVTLTSQRPLIEAFHDMLHRMADHGPIGLLAGSDANITDTRLLARLLGGTVLRPDDLSCSSGTVQLRTLAGSTPIRLLLRQTSSLAIDPLEQGGAPSLGIPGLFRALRNGQLTMLNAPGTAILQSSGIKSYLPGMLHQMLGRVPKLAQAVDHNPSRHPVNRVPIAARIAGAGGMDRFDTATAILRFYALRIDGSWCVLPGGLGYAARPDGTPLVKDIWIIDAGEPAFNAFGLRAANRGKRGKPLGARTVAMDMPSRLADDLLWLGRFVERLDVDARLLAIALPRFTDISTLPHEAAQRESLAACLVSAKLVPADIIGPFMSARRLHESLSRKKPFVRLVADIRRLIDDSGERFSVSMRKIVEAALDQIPHELADEAHLLTACMQFVATFNGAIAEDASRSGGFVFLEIGRRLERAEALAQSLAILLAGPLNRVDPGLILAIELADAQLTCEPGNAGQMDVQSTITLLLSAADYPRSLAFQTEALAVAFRRVNAENEALEMERLTCDLHAVCGDITAGISVDIGKRLAEFSTGLETVSDNLVAKYFAPIPLSRQVSEQF